MRRLNLVLISLFSCVFITSCAEKKPDNNIESEKILNEIISDMVRLHQLTSNNNLVFYMGKYEVTQRQWEGIMGNNPSYFKYDENLPVECVSMNDCQEFINKLNNLCQQQKLQWTFRLPTSEEWEYVCRAGSHEPYGFTTPGVAGNIDKIGWYYNNSDGKTHPVGQKTANAFGFYDMHGNVWEWTTSSSCRGGSYLNPSNLCEANKSWKLSQVDRNTNIGFRLFGVKTR